MLGLGSIWVGKGLLGRKGVKKKNTSETEVLT